MLRLSMLLAVLLASIVGGACGEDAPVNTDETIRAGVLAQLEANNFTSVTAEVKEGVVTLSGTAYTQADAERAVSLAKSVLGVVSVENKISFGEPPEAEPETPDELLGARLTQTFKASPSLAGSNISAKVVGGVATLSGTVATDAAKTEAERIAKTIPGISSVDNKLEVKAVEIATVPDKEIEADVRELVDQSYPDLLITPSVAGGVVKLRGAVDSNKQVLEITDRISKIKGVKAVDTSLLTVTGSEDTTNRIGAPAN